MNFYGAVMALVLVPMSNVVELQWTNPPDRDLQYVKFQAWQVGSRDTLNLPDYYGVSYWTDQPSVIYPSSRDSIWLTLPCRSSGSQWGFRCAGVDTAGNVAAWSNYAFKTVTP